MEALQELFDLYEREVSITRTKPPLRPEPIDDGTQDGGTITPDMSSDSIATPASKKRDEVDALVASGMPPEQAYQEVMGPINLADPEYKAGLAACLARHDKSNEIGNVHPDPDSESIFAKIERAIDRGEVSDADLKTPSDEESPDVVQKTISKVAEDVGSEVEPCYTDDVDYLRKYGRA